MIVLAFIMGVVFAALPPYTAELQRRIDSCSAAGGGRVVVPAGVHETGAVALKSNVELHLENDAVLLFSDNPADCLPAVRTSWEGIECYNYSPLVYAYGATNIAITGKGRLEAKMDGWKRWGGLRKPQAEAAKRMLDFEWGPHDVPVEARDLTKMEGANLRPPFIGLNACRGVRLEDFSIRNTPFWTIHILHSEDVALRRLDVSANCINNSDGANFECTRNVLVEDCSFDQGDDVICCKSGKDRDGRRRGMPTEHVRIRRCRVKAGHGLLTIGSECSGGVRDVLMEDCAVEGSCMALLNVKTRPTRGGVIENVTLRRIKADQVTDAVVKVSTRNADWANYESGLPVALTRIDGLAVEDVAVGEAQVRMRAVGEAECPIRNLTVRNLRVGKAQEPDVVEHVEGFSESR